MVDETLLWNSVYSLRAKAAVLEIKKTELLKEAGDWERVSDFIWTLDRSLSEWFDQLAEAQLERDCRVHLADTVKRQVRTLRRKAEKLERKAYRVVR